ncbi:F-box/kelch-repeat protein At5g26960-like [Dioscorea cayenensis subsp. rotundata]|uniref:F-box/kelch-repeat protein At5g26960-like n=1 Tax=Dioscorea cayennensis subsp. rotundata TaxID=55577 RepID=A0AB40BHW0_DIOCR|nr:F-box/kelch-repeat protein At5g26960-like [Dioscorea cayenensis subsp. rotundata]
MAETCNPRRLPWLIKSCIPDPRREAAKLPSGTRPPPTVTSTAASPSISSLPDDLLLEILSRVPQPSIPSLSLVCRRFALLLDSPSFYALRRSHGLLRPALHALSFAAAAIAGRIYVAGGAARSSAVEEYDPDLDSWRIISDAPRRRYGCVGATASGVFYVIGGLIVGSSPRAGRLDAHVWAGTMDTYEVETGVWGSRRAASVPGGGCVVGACGAGSHVYVLASHAVEVSFWRWDAGKGRRGDWLRLEPPPITAHLRLGGAARFCCSALGQDKIVALVHVSSDASRRRGSTDGVVLVYDIVKGEWNRGPDLPVGFRRAALACVEC